MWFYDQAMRQYKDPKMAVRAKAEFRAQERMRRLESMKWFGFSNSRPRGQQRSVPRRLLADVDCESGLLSVALERRGPDGVLLLRLSLGRCVVTPLPVGERASGNPATPAPNNEARRPQANSNKLPGLGHGRSHWPIPTCWL